MEVGDNDITLEEAMRMKDDMSLSYQARNVAAIVVNTYTKVERYRRDYEESLADLNNEKRRLRDLLNLPVIEVCGTLSSYGPYKPNRPT